MYNKQQLPIDNDIVYHQYSANSDRITQQWEEILNNMDPTIRLSMLVFIDKIQTLDEEWGINEYIQDND